MKSWIQFYLFLIFCKCMATPAFAQSCQETSIQSPVPFMGNQGEIIKVANGTVWEIRFAYEYLYAYYPNAVLCASEGKLIVNDKVINVRQLSTKGLRSTDGQRTIESAIVSEFSGLNMGNIYKLANGQIWEQTEAWIWVWISVNPSVIIQQGPRGYMMKVENIDHAVGVRQLQ